MSPELPPSSAAALVPPYDADVVARQARVSSALFGLGIVTPLAALMLAAALAEGAHNLAVDLSRASWWPAQFPAAQVAAPIALLLGALIAARHRLGRPTSLRVYLLGVAGWCALWIGLWMPHRTLDRVYRWSWGWRTDPAERFVAEAAFMGVAALIVLLGIASMLAARRAQDQSARRRALAALALGLVGSAASVALLCLANS